MAALAEPEPAAAVAAVPASNLSPKISKTGPLRPGFFMGGGRYSAK